MQAMSTDESIDFERVAAAIVAAGSPAPTVLHARRVPAYEVEFEALEIVLEQPLSATDRAALGLVAALGVATNLDVATYLGLGSTLSALLIQRLVTERLIAPHQNKMYPGLRPAYSLDAYGYEEDIGGNAYEEIRRMMGEGSFHDERRGTEARPVEPRAGAHGLAPARFTLTDVGRETLRTNVRRITKTRSACLIFWAEPLHFVQVLEKSRKKYAKTHEAKTLQADAVPPSLAVIDELLRKPIDERDRMIGLGKNVKNIDGELVRCVPGSQWIVRPSRAERCNLLVVAGTVEWRFGWDTFTGTDDQLAPTPRLDPDEIDLHELDMEFDLGVVLSALPGAELASAAMTPDGAVRATCTASTLIRLLGTRAHPTDAWSVLPSASARWSSAVRVRAIPDSEPAAHLALLEILSRRSAAMSANLDSTVDAAWRDLCAYWDEPAFSPPEREWLFHALWIRPALRGAVCRHRLHDDLVAAYAAPAEAR
jgi:hypothetical protein